MRLLRALAYLLLALALATGPVGQACAMAPVPVAHTAAHGHHVAATVGGPTHDCDGSPAERPIGKPHRCHVACCSLPTRLPEGAGEATTVEFRSVRYADLSPSTFGRSPAPDPKIPKHTA